MIDLFEKKKMNEFSKKVKSVFNLMTISRKFNIIGSSALKNIRYSNDYDLNELYSKQLNTQEALTTITKMFQAKFVEANKDPTLFITDFKCGIDKDGEPLRWNKVDMAKGYKTMNNGETISFSSALLLRSVTKLDVVKILDGVFTEFSDNYYIKLGNKANFDPLETENENMKHSLEQSFHEYYYEQNNLFKGLKRSFSYFLFDGEKKNKATLTKLMNFFNSPIGKIYQAKSNIGTIVLLIENVSEFREPSIADVKKNIQIVKSKLAEFPFKNVERHLDSALKSSSLKLCMGHISQAETGLKEIVNRSTEEFVYRNPKVILH
jgi:hypothetical protein